MRISREQMASRQRMNRLRAAIANGIDSATDLEPFTYAEIIMVLSELTARWTGELWEHGEDDKEP